MRNNLSTAVSQFWQSSAAILPSQSAQGERGSILHIGSIVPPTIHVIIILLGPDHVPKLIKSIKNKLSLARRRWKGIENL